MNLKEILQESITFGVSKIEHENGKKIYADRFSVKKEQECWACDGTGKDYNPQYPCRRCEGSGKSDDWVSPYEQLNVSNSNANAILDMLGAEFDYSGAIEKEQLPLIRRKLIALKNKDISPHTQAPTKSGGEMRTTTDDNGVSRIGRGATIYDAGRSHSQVERYIDSLLKIIDFAQKKTEQ